jgi:HEPN domain-containing protein
MCKDLNGLIIRCEYCHKCFENCESINNSLCFRIIRNQMIETCFVQTADADYILSRYCYRSGDLENYCYHASQAIEKYLKAILLYHDEVIKKSGHNLENLREKVKQKLELKSNNDIDIDYICKENPVSYSKEVKYSFIETVNLNVDRYGIIPFIFPFYYNNINYLSLLDKTIFKLRNFCNDIELQAFVLSLKGRELEEFLKLNSSQQGYLEKILEESPNQNENLLLKKENLLWNNESFLSNQKQHYQIMNYFLKDKEKCGKSLNKWCKLHFKVTSLQTVHLDSIFGCEENRISLEIKE